MNLPELHEELFDLTIRIDKIILLAAAINEDSMSEDLQQILEEEDYTLLEKLFGLPAQEADAQNWDHTAIREWLVDHRKFGFLIQLATPVREYFSEKSWSSSWGYYSTPWIYADTLEEAIELAKQWAEAHHLKALEKFKAKGGAA
jgi:hypothetical protein